MCGVISAILLASWEVLYGLYFNSAGLFQMGKHAWQMWISHKKILLKGFSSRHKKEMMISSKKSESSS